MFSNEINGHLIMKVNETYIKRSERFIEKQGTTNLARALGVTAATVTNWKRRGIPQGYRLFIEKEYRQEWDRAEKA